MLDEKANGAHTFDDLGRLTRLAADLRSDAGRLEGFAKDVDELIVDVIDEIRNAEHRGEAA